jgi:hypothetical protein
MPDLDDQKEGELGTGRSLTRGPKSGDADRLLNPDGIYSGMTRRLAATDGAFVEVQGMPKDYRNRGRMPYGDKASGRKSTS